MQKRVLLIVAAILGIGILAGGYYIYDQYISTKTYIERITGIEFPSWTTTEEEFDNGEFAVVAKYTLSESYRESFIQDNELLEYSRNPIQLTFADGLLPQNKPNYFGAYLYALEDCTKNHSWKILTNQQTGELWIEVQYPDFGGDAPACNKLE